MTLAIEDIKRLVPECTYVAQSGDHISGLAFGIGFSIGDPWFQALLATRSEVERLRNELEDIEGMVSGNLMTGGRPWSDFSKQVQTKARHALEKGE